MKRCLKCGKRFRNPGSLVCAKCAKTASMVHIAPELFTEGPAAVEAKRARLESDRLERG
jgi:hypothetical protein